MAENIEQKEKLGGDRGRADFLTISLGVGLTHLLPAWELLPTAEAALVAWSVAFAVGYWLPPKPSESYVRWMLERLILVIAFYLAFFKIPVWLRQWLPRILAYGIPILTFFCSVCVVASLGKAVYFKRRA
jgi:hypothetical protein